MNEMSNMGYDPTETECPDCDDGVLWVNSHELVCGNCGITLRKHESTDRDFSHSRDDERPRYNNSGLVILPGGFPHAFRGDGLYGGG